MRKKRKLAAVTTERQEEHLGTASHETRPFLELTRNISHSFPKRLKAKSVKKLSQEFI